MDFVGAFGFLSYLIFAITIAVAIGLFFYGRTLVTQKEDMDSDLAQARKDIDPATADSFIRLNNRLTAGKTLLSNHIAMSNFFLALETTLPSTVHFSSLRVTHSDDKTIVISGSGTAKTFNALAAAAESFAEDGKIKNAIFSQMTISKDNSVTFSLSANLDPHLVVFSALPPVATTTAREANASTTASTTPDL